MSKKSDFVAQLLKEVKPRQPIPSAPKEGFSLVEQGAVLVLMRHITQTQAENSVVSLRSAYLDWNEVRVTQAQEIAAHLDLKSSKARSAATPAARELRGYLHEVFQKIHGLDLDVWREDLQAAGKLLGEMPKLGLAAGSYLLFLAAGEQIPMHAALSRFLDRLGVITRTTSINKAREQVEALLPKGQRLEFTVVIHEVLDRWTDRLEPIYLTVDALRTVPLGKKAAQDWETAAKRLEQQRERELARQEAARRKEEAREKREEERERKRREADAKRVLKEQEARKREEQKQRKKREAEAKKKADAQKAAKAEAARKVAAKKAAAEAKKREAAEKKAAAAAKKAAKKTAKKAAKKTTKKAAPKKTAAKKAAPKKAAAKKSSTKVAKKKATKKKAAKKSTAKKTGTKAAATKKVTPKKPAAKKVTPKKPASKKSSSKKKTTKKATSRKKARG